MSLLRDKKVLDFVESAVLRPDEAVRWKGRPRPISGAGSGIANFIVGICVAAVMLFFMYLNAQDGNLLFFFVCSIFFSIGAWAVWSPIQMFLHATRTYYAITNRRIIIVTANEEIEKVSILPNEIDGFSVWKRRNGSGNVHFLSQVEDGIEGPSALDAFNAGLWVTSDVEGAANAVAALGVRQL